jgi:hypothetical protein
MALLSRPMAAAPFFVVVLLVLVAAGDLRHRSSWYGVSIDFQC